MIKEAVSYQDDFYGWLTTTARLLRTGEISKIDFDHIAEELEAMSKSERRELAGRLTVLLTHLLKWQYQPEKRSRSWQNTIKIQRIDISELLQDSPSLVPVAKGRKSLAKTQSTQSLLW